jgi:hypothetical protein
MFTTTQIKLAAIALLAAGTLGSATAALAPVHLVFPDGARQDAWVEVATEVAIRFKDQANGVNTKDLRIKDLTSLFFYEPSEYTEAMSLFKGRKYAEALPKFEACAAAYKDTLDVVGNYSALSRYYAMECHRKLGNIEAMMKVREGFRKERLSREADRIQFDLYPLLEAVSKRSWEKVEAQAKQWLARNDLSGSQRAQAGYCLGMAHEQAGRIEDAMIAFGIGMTASCGEDETVIRESAIGALRTLNNDPLVKTAIKLYGTEHEADQSTGHLRLLEAGRLATVFPKRFGAGRALPPEFTPLLQYKKKEAAAEAPGK